LGDTPYIIDVNNTDGYPLMHPWSPLPVHNINTGLGYAAIQEAINANETLDRHTIFVEAGIYFENVIVNKTLSLIGENEEATIVDGGGNGDALTIIANSASLSTFTLQAPSLFNQALRLENVSDTTIVNNTLKNSFSGLAVRFSNFNTIMNNSIAPGEYYSTFVNSSYNTLTGNIVGGLLLRDSFNNTLAENAIESFRLSFSPNTKLRENNFSYFQVDGDIDLHFVHDIDSSNMLNEKPIYYWVNRENAEVPSDAGYVALVNCLNITVRGLDFENNFQSILMFSTNNSRILNNNVTRTNDGIWVISSSNNTISGNNITANSNVGVGLWQASNNTVSGNDVTDNGIGIYLYAFSDCTVSGNDIANNTNGIYLYGSSGNRFFHNNFTGNPQQVYSSQSANVWDDGYPSGGNYWSNYTGVDLDHDGIGDSAHVIDTNNTDHYPLMGMFSDFNATSELHVQPISNSTITDFRFDGAAIRFNVTGEEGTAGFCRICVPKELMAEPYHVFVNGTEILPQPQPLPCSNSTHNYLYFSYTHSTQEVIVIPEFPSFLILSLFMIATLLAVKVHKRKHTLIPDRR